MKSDKQISFYVFLTIIAMAAAVVAQDRQAFIERLSSALSEAFEAYDSDKQVRPAALEILNANEALSAAFRRSLNEDFEGVSGALEDAQGALLRAGGIFIEIAGQDAFREDAVRLQNELFFISRGSPPETASDALFEFGNACIENATILSNLVSGEGDLSILRAVLSDVSALRLAIASFYGIVDERM